MRYAVIVLLVALFVTPAHAYPGSWTPQFPLETGYSSHTPRDRHFTRHRHIAHQRARHRHYGYSGGLSGACQSARRQGGPCGCVAQEKIFGLSARLLNGINLWLARSWLGFPRTSPAAGMAAVWPGRHVEAVASVNGDGTVTTDGPYGLRRVRIGSVVFVNPHGSYAGYREGHRRYVYRHRRYRHYASR
jgi:hypothetical protein